MSRAAYCAHPMLSEDAGTQGAGNAEIEFGHSWTREDGDLSRLFQPQFSYGYAQTVDLILQPSWLANTSASGGHGFGDTNLDAKWRFHTAAPWSWAVRAGLELVTAEHGQGLPYGKVSPHAAWIATIEASPFILDMNLGYAFVPDSPRLRSDLYHVSGAAIWAVHDRLSLTLDIALDSDPDPAKNRPPATLLAGVIYTVVPGLDVDAGYLTGLNSPASAKQWLFGVTYRWTP